eukprot:113875_1
MSLTQQKQDYCLGCGHITTGHKTAGGLFYCDSCWEQAYQRQQQYKGQSNSPNKTFRNSHNKHIAQHFSANSPKRLSSARKSALSSQSLKNNDNNTIDLMHQISSLKQENIQLRSQIDIIMQNNTQLQQENRLLNNLGDGIEKYDYMQIKEENEHLMEDAERLSMNVKKVMFELKDMKASNDAQQIEIESLHAQMDQERKMRMLAEETLTTKQAHWKFMKQQKDIEILKLNERLRTEPLSFDFMKPKSVQNTAQKFGSTVSNRKTKKNDRGSKKTRSFKKGRERRDSQGSVRSMESGSSHHSLDVNVLPSKSILTGVSKSALMAGGYRDLTRRQIRQLQPPMNHTQSVPHSVTVPIPSELKKKKSLPNNIGMVAPPTQETDEMSDNDSDDVEDLYKTSSLAMNAPNGNVHRAYRAQSRTNRKPNGKSHRTTYEVQRDRNTDRMNTLKQQSWRELDSLRQNAGGNVDKSVKLFTNTGKY